jgi:hypothetical protein
VTGAEWAKLLIVLHVFVFFAALGFGEQTIIRYDGGEDKYFSTIALSLLSLASFFLVRLRSYQRWLALAPFVFSSFAPFASNPGLNPRILADGCREQRAFRGDDYRQLIAQNIPDRWRTLDQALAEVGRLPCRWRSEGFVTIGRWLSPDQFALFMRDDARPDAPQAVSGDGSHRPAKSWRSWPESARRNAAIGQGMRLPRYLWECETSAHPETACAAVLAGSCFRQLDKEFALALADGLGRGILDIDLDDSLRPLLAGRNPVGNEQIRRKMVERVSTCSAVLPQLTNRECALAVLRGIAFWFGIEHDRSAEHVREVDEGNVRRTRSRAAPFFFDADDPEEQRAFDEGLTAGLENWIKNTVNRFAIRSQAIDFPRLRDGLAEQGVLCRPIPDRPDEYEVVIAPCARPARTFGILTE